MARHIRCGGPRRGVLMLLVLALLAMFGLLAISYVMISGNAKRGTMGLARVEQSADSPGDQLNLAAGQVIRGSPDLASVLYPHSLLEDMYGNPLAMRPDGLPLRVSLVYPVLPNPVVQVCGGQIANVYLDIWNLSYAQRQQVASDVKGRIGSVMTVVAGGPARFVSFRVVGCYYDDNSTYSSDPTTPPPPPKALLYVQVVVERALPQAGDNLVINGLPFGGTGQGYNPGTVAAPWMPPGVMNLPYTEDVNDPRRTWPIALLPRPFANRLDYNLWRRGLDGQPGRASIDDDGNGTPDDDSELGAAGSDDPSNALVSALAATQMNEDYDAPDFQTMILGMMLPGGLTPMPSLHRPELVNYWMNQPGTLWNHPTFGPQLRRKVVLRPLARLPGDLPTFPADHPDFTGSNPGGIFDPVAGPWDVDNDGDGIPDSVWVDLGLPVRMTKDGRLYKPLFAILCLDMDGRLNLNAHGSTAQTVAEYGNAAIGPFAGATPPNYDVPLPRGEGYGPAEIGFPATMIPLPQVRQLLQGDGANEGRYGELSVPSPGAQAGVTNTWDALTRVKFFEFPDDSYLDSIAGGTLDTSRLTAFGSPPDLWGRGVFGVDYAGQPLYWRPTTYGGAPMDWWSSEVLNNPYRLNLALKAVRRASPTGSTVDNPFTVGELEAVLRGYDADAGRLPRRLLDLAPSLAGRRTEVTTESFDVPCPPGSLPLSPEVIVFPAGTRANGLSDLLAKKLVHGRGYTLPLSAAQQNTIIGDIRMMLPSDVLANRRMDINRPLGNGRDSNGNGVVDEWQEAAGETGWYNIFARNSGGPAGTTDGNNDGKIDAVTFWLTNAVDVNGDGNVDAADQPLARHLMARHLYVLGMLLAEMGYEAPGGGGQNLFFFPTPGEVAGLSDAERRELTARRVAQWAINVVDFRDADGIMTPFEYDVNPFNGWSVDGDVSTDEGGERRIVWGCEAPELLLTEVLAFHDRRVADTNYDSTGAKRTDDADNNSVPDDVDLDQPLIPRGSTFLELYCTRNPNNTAAAPTELYTYSGGQWYLDVGRLAPPGGGGRQYPVWRIAISESRIANAANDVLTYAQGQPHSASIEPRQQRGMAGGQSKNGRSLLYGSTDAAVEIDRIIWLSTTAPQAGHSDYQRVYYNRTNTTGIPCGGYAVVGPRFETRIGGTTTLGEPSPHAIYLDPVRVVDNDGTNRYPDNTTTVKPAASIVVAADPPNSWGPNSAAADLDPDTSHGLSGTRRYGIGISISEPIPGLPGNNYYPEPREANSRYQINGTAITEAYCDVTNGNITGNPNIMDHPFDSERTGGVFQRPLGTDGILRTQTNLNYKTVFLQRLANPGQPYQPDPSAANWNPYVTVDWSPIDLTVFNGTDRVPGAAIPGGYAWDTLDDGTTPADDNPNADSSVRFASRQRGGHTFSGGANLWAVSTIDPSSTVNQNVATLNFRHNLGWNTTTAPVVTNQAHIFGQTLGYVNRGYGMPWNPPTAPPLLRQVYRGTPATPMANPAPTDLHPFPWLTWNNRPFTTPAEILMVPTSSPARLCWEFSTATNVGDVFTGPSNPGGATPVYGIPFGHLLNFFQGEAAGGLTNPPYFYRLLDFLEVPSRFVGTELILNPQYAGSTPLEQHLFRPPFNMVSNFRDPGRVNVNTIASANVWAGVLNGHTGPSFDDIVESRRGYGAGGNIADMVPGYPTRYANPFRSASSADLAPNVANLLKARPVSVTLLRAAGVNPDATNVSLVAAPAALPSEACRNPDQNAFFRYQSLSRLSNLLTTRSNVFAVWITVGYFEVGPDPVSGQYTIDAGHPDGYRLGRELGGDSGDLKRHRAFYLIDRSIPVGFSRGRDYNAGNTILLNRFIE